VPPDDHDLEFCSDAWLAALDAAVLDIPADRLCAPLVVNQTVGERTWHVRVEGRTVTVRPGHSPEAPVGLVHEPAAARAIVRGEEPPGAAFLDGRVRVDGDVRVLIDAADVLAALDAAWAPVRERTRA
jgi:hypothetical protein